MSASKSSHFADCQVPRCQPNCNSPNGYQGYIWDTNGCNDLCRCVNANNNPCAVSALRHFLLPTLQIAENHWVCSQQRGRKREIGDSIAPLRGRRSKIAKPDFANTWSTIRSGAAQSPLICHCIKCTSFDLARQSKLLVSMFECSFLGVWHHFLSATQLWRIRKGLEAFIFTTARTGNAHIVRRNAPTSL